MPRPDLSAAQTPYDRHAPARRVPPLARYANYFEVGHNAFEFLLDAGQIEPETGDVQFTDRIAISPVHAKLLGDLLARSISQFEAQHGAIPSLVDEVGDALSLTCPDDFEARALDARRRAATANSPSAPEDRPLPQER